MPFDTPISARIGTAYVMSWRGGQTSHRGGDNQGRKEVYGLLKTSGATNKVFKAVPVGD